MNKVLKRRNKQRSDCSMQKARPKCDWKIWVKLQRKQWVSKNQ